MVAIIGNVKPEDDYTHPLGPEDNFNESVYFNFFDREQNRGGFIRMGSRANEGHAEMTVIIFNSDGSVFSITRSLKSTTTMSGMLVAPGLKSWFPVRGSGLPMKAPHYL